MARQRKPWGRGYTLCAASFLMVICWAHSQDTAVPPFALLQSCTASSCVVDPSRLMMLSIGSVLRSELQLAQNKTWGQHLTVAYYNEVHLPSCVLCDPQVNGSKQRVRPVVYQDNGIKPNTSKSEAWWCAQKRPLQAVRDFLGKRITRKQWPQWLMVVDDDCWVNPERLKQLLDGLHPTWPQVVGYFTSHYLLGGAGWLINLPVMEALMAPPPGSRLYDPQQNTTLLREAGHANNSGTVVDASIISSCIHMQSGGPWCLFHSDWAVLHCLRRAGIHIQETHTQLFSQCCKHPDPNKCYMGHEFLINCTLLELATCHYTSATHLTQLYKDWSAAG